MCLLGRNGEGKSTLIKILAQQLQAEDGVMQWQSGHRAALLAQEPVFSGDGTVFQVIATGLGELAEVISQYHTLSTQITEDSGTDQLAQLNRLQHRLEAEDGWRLEQRVEQVISRLKLPAEARVSSLSGGWQRRLALGQALVQQPDLLLLDEPTNHLDVESIEWLETFLLDYPGAVLFVTHDRSFLQRLATRILELDRGKLTSWPGDYENYLRRKEERQHEEEKHNTEFDKKLAQEEAWIRQGIKARRTRNEGRVRALKAMREERRARISQQGKASLALGGGEQSGKMAIEAQTINKSFAGQEVVKDFSCRILRGDRIGLLGPNGAGKTTLLKMLLGELKPDSGSVRLGSNLQIAYFDQHREHLDENLSAIDNVAGGSETVQVNGRPVHVISYLQRFLFSPERVRAPISSLSGGERNRLLLARLFTRPVNLLVLDEPTNDLDLETLEALEELLIEFDGTLLLVSHDRSFLDNVVTATLVFEGNGKIQAYAGGYEDWLVQRPKPVVKKAPVKPVVKKAPVKPVVKKAPVKPVVKKAPVKPVVKKAPVKPVVEKALVKPVKVEKTKPANSARKLSYNEQRELGQLPERIEQLEVDLEELQTLTSQAGFYQRDAADIKATLTRLESLQQELEAAYQRWQELDAV